MLRRQFNTGLIGATLGLAAPFAREAVQKATESPPVPKKLQPPLNLLCDLRAVWGEPYREVHEERAVLSGIRLERGLRPAGQLWQPHYLFALIKNPSHMLKIALFGKDALLGVSDLNDRYGLHMSVNMLTLLPDDQLFIGMNVTGWGMPFGYMKVFPSLEGTKEERQHRLEVLFRRNFPLASYYMSRAENEDLEAVS